MAKSRDNDNNKLRSINSGKISSQKAVLHFYRQSSEWQPKVFIKTFGCQMNTYDSAFTEGLLIDRGFTAAGSEREADIIIFNTCSVRQHAEERVFGRIRQLKRQKQKKPGLIIGVMGCMANAYAESLIEKFPHVDFVSGTRDFQKIPEIIERVIEERSPEVCISESGAPSVFSPHTRHENRLKAFVPIMRGCDNFCSYCIVPYVRGRETSREAKEIIDEIQYLVTQGYKEVTLLGQNVNSYGKHADERITFAELLRRVAAIDGIDIIRFLTSHPKDVSRELFEVMASVAKVETHLHLPLQSGSDIILQSMNRGYTIADYKKHVALLRELVPGVSITTDLIVGFCGETAAEYEKTKATMTEIAFDGAFIFKYSPRANTKAYTLKDDVPLSVKEQRNNELLALQRTISANTNARMLNTTVKVLAEAISRKNAADIKGRTWNDKEVVFPGGEDLIGRVVTVRLDKLSNETFIGTLLS